MTVDGVAGSNPVRITFPKVEYVISKRTLNLIEGMCEQYNRQATEALFLVYDVGLQDLSSDQVELAIIQAMRECEYMPTVKVIRDLVKGKPEDVAQLAFFSLSENVSSYDTLDFQDKRINATVRQLGGMQRICDMPAMGEEFHVWFRKEFLRVYALYQRRGVGDEEGKPLAGIYGKPAAGQISATYNVGDLRLAGTELEHNLGISHSPDGAIEIEHSPKGIMDQSILKKP